MTVMNVNRGKYVPPASQSALALRNGQIVQGEIVKIYPQNKAEIQIGVHRLIAEINTSLGVGKKYFFQVNETTNKIAQLRVLGDSLKQNMKQNITQLLDKLGLKVNRQNVQLLNTLLADKIPFNHQQLSQAITLLESTANKQDAISLIKEMFVKKVPIIENTFQALHTLRNSTLSTSINQLFTDLSNNPQANNIQKQLQLLLEQVFSQQEKTDTPFHDRIGNQINRNEFMSTLLHQSKQLLVNQSASLSREQHLMYLNQMLFSRSENNTIPTERLVDITTKLMDGANTLKANATEILHQFQTALSTSTSTSHQFVALQQMIQAKIIPLLPEAVQHSIGNVLQQNTQVNQTAIYHLLQTFAHDATYPLLEAATNALQQEASHFHVATKIGFLNYVQQFIQSMGIQDEHHIRMNVEQLITNQSDQPLQQQQSIKTHLLQMLQDGNQTINDKLLPFIHLINGLQLQSVHESQNMIQATLQLPGEKFALPKDLFFQFEGKKTEDGKLDPKHCRILFVLHLQHIEETIIDMFIQKRIVTLTIYNDHVNMIQNKGENLTDILTEHLEGLDFQLSTIKWKRLSEQEQQQMNSNQAEVRTNDTKERFDFRI